MIKKITHAESIVSLWKNAKGRTQQIDIHPPEASLNDPFDYRLSSAFVSEAADFSVFSGLDRILIVRSGQGLRINGEALLPHTPHFFSGDEKISCEIIGDTPVIDVGLMFDRKKFRGHAEVIKVSGTKNYLPDENEIVFFFHALGSSCLINGVPFSEGETLKIINGGQCMIESADAIIYRFSLI